MFYFVCFFLHAQNLRFLFVYFLVDLSQGSFSVPLVRFSVDVRLCCALALTERFPLNFLVSASGTSLPFFPSLPRPPPLKRRQIPQAGMSGNNEVSGNNDPGKEPLLAAQWAVSGVLYVGFLFSSIYTQVELLRLSRKNVNLQVLHKYVDVR